MNFSLYFLSPIFASSLTDYFIQSNFAGQVIVVILLVFSVLAWGVMFCKKADLTATETENKKTSRAFKASGLVEAAGNKSLSGPYARVLKDAVNAWLRAGTGNSTEEKSSRIARVENAIERSVSRQIVFLNSKMTLLGTVISGAPFLGLLGTAWGVMDCFGSMSAQTSVTLQMLAPGVAGALLTTVAGLVVAIPSVFGYNYLTAKAAELSVDLENFASYIADEIEIESAAIAANNQESEREYRQKTPPRAVRDSENYTAKPSYSQPLQERRATISSEQKMSEFSFDDDDDSPTPPRQFDE